MFAVASPAASVAGANGRGSKTHFCPPGTGNSAYCECPRTKDSAHSRGTKDFVACECPSATSVASYPATLFVPAGYATIGAAVAAAAPGSRIIVGPGTYHEDVTVTKPLTIVGHNATVDATNQNNGFTLPAPAAGTRIEGFTIENAVGEGILAVSTSNLCIVNNTIENNDKGLPPAVTSYAECLPSGGGPGDCGEGVHLMSTTNSWIVGNTIRDNAGGVLLTDEIGPTDGNVVAHNLVLNNTADCGITLAGHNPAAAPGGIRLQQHRPRQLAQRERPGRCDAAQPRSGPGPERQPDRLQPDRKEQRGRRPRLPRGRPVNDWRVRRHC
jgi:parallel beta-helix repeat protein